MNGRKGRFTAWAMGTTAAAMALSTMMFTATAATTNNDNSNFTTHYNQNVQLEAQLLQKAQAEGGSSATITALSHTVQTINTQVAALYSAEQALAAAAANIPEPSSISEERAKLTAQKQKLLQNIADARAKINAGLKAKHYVDARRLQLEIKTWMAQITQINFQLNHLSDGEANWKLHPYNNGLPELQQSIFDLQKSAIHYTDEWIEVAKPTTPTNNPASATGLAYTTAVITIPVAGSAAVTDGVAVMPVVKDAQGNVLTDSGTFTLSGPSGASGVSIDATTGQVSVSAGATAGTYVVTYTQGTVTNSAAIVFSH